MISVIALSMIFNVYFFLQHIYKTLIVEKCAIFCKKLRAKMKAKAKIEDAAKEEVKEE
jgi:hypothetical protein